MAKSLFHIADYVVFVAVLIISVSIGLYYAFTGGRQKTNKEFLMGNRHMKIGPVTLSLLVSFMSAILLLGFPAEMYTRGTLQWMSLIGMMLACTLSAVTFVPLLYPLKLTSSFEYLELRFQSRSVRLIGNLSSLLSMVLYMGVALFAPSTALEAVTGFPFWGTIVIVGGVATFYTTLGGMKAVVWTDVFQAVVMYAGILAVLIQGCVKVGGLSKVWEICVQGGRIEFLNFDPDPSIRHTTWGVIIGPTIMWLAVYGTNQASVQRFCALPTQRKAMQAVLMNIPLLFVLVSTTCLAGISIYAYYAQQGCDPLINGDISNANQLMPHFVMEVLNFPGIPGLVVASLFSGALSSISSALSAIAANVWEDILKHHFGYFSDLRQTIVTKCIVIVSGGLAIGMAMVASLFRGHVAQASFSFAGATSGQILGLFILGAFFPCANWKGAVAGGLVGLILPLWLSFGSYFALRGPAVYLPTINLNCSMEMNNASMQLYNSSYGINVTHAQSLRTTSNDLTTAATPFEATGINKLYTLSYIWYPLVGAVAVNVIGLAVSACTGLTKREDLNPDYIVPVVDTFCRCLPMQWREKIPCGRRVSSDNTQYKNGTQSADGEYHVELEERTYVAKGDAIVRRTAGKDGYRFVASN